MERLQRWSVTYAILVAALLAAGCGHPNEPFRPSPKSPQGTTSSVESSYPPAVLRNYEDKAGTKHVYLVQEPIGGPDKNAAVMICLHGFGASEEQGMDPAYAKGSFARLRGLLARRGWIYTSPRDREMTGLLADLTARYGTRRMFLAGTSAGGRQALLAAQAHPNAFSGLILMCPDIFYPAQEFGDIHTQRIPVWVVSGDADRQINAACVALTRTWAKRNPQVAHVEIPGGTHSTPLEQIDWERALNFVAEGDE